VADIIYGNFNAEAIKAIKKSLKTSEVNPLYIYGSYGSGKSFLVQKMKEEYKGESTFIEAQNFDPSLIKEYFKKNLFILEDLEFLPQESPNSETLFKIISYFIEKNKQIVFTADRLPPSLNLSKRIISRIETGVIVRIKAFDKASRKKVIRILGKNLPPKIINQLIEKDIKSISQAIGAIKKARVLGYVAKEKEERTKHLMTIRAMGEYDKFINEVKETFSESINISEKEQKLRDEYSSKMYVWEMKGFNTDRIKKVIDGSIDKLTSEFVSFTMDIQRLIELQRRYGILSLGKLSDNKTLREDEIQEIEEALFDPDKANWLSMRISELEDQEDEFLTRSKRSAIEKEEKEKSKMEISRVNIDKLSEELKLNLNNNNFRLIKDY